MQGLNHIWIWTELCGYIEFKVVLNFFGCTVNKIWSDDLVTWMDHHHCNKLKAKYIIAFLTQKTLAQKTHFPILVTIFTNAKKQLTHTDTHVRACACVCVCVFVCWDIYLEKKLTPLKEVLDICSKLNCSSITNDVTINMQLRIWSLRFLDGPQLKK